MTAPKVALSVSQKPVQGSGHPAMIPTAALALNPGGSSAVETPSRPPIDALYIHTPFCVHKCHYCDFYSFVDNRDQQSAFVDRLIDELRFLAPHAARPLRSIFVGGGTPSLLRVELWERLLGVLNAEFDLSLMQSTGCDKAPSLPVPLGEFTVECNPESTTRELLSLLKVGGVNRVSVGAQSFHPAHLKTLERWHDPANVVRAVELARAAGIERQSVDLIFAIPGQTLDEWADDLDRALALRTTHLSCYNLTYEPNTAMTKRLSQGEFEPISDELEAEMFAMTWDRTAQAGLPGYEVSNFAKPGHESIHNLAYWEQKQWLAAGPSASGHAFALNAPVEAPMRLGSWRWKNLPRLGDYLAVDAARIQTGSAGAAPVVDVEAPDPVRLVRERLMMGLRLIRGIDAASLLGDLVAVKPDAVKPLLDAVARVRLEGLAQVQTPGAVDERWMLTPAGMMVADSVAAALMDAVGE